MAFDSGKPLGISLGIDFSSLDRDLNKVADKIEAVGRETSLKVGTLSGLAIKGDISGDKLAAQVAQVGTELSRGMSAGVRMSSALMLSFGARINAMLDRFAGVGIAAFTRIDAAIKGKRWDTMFTRMSISLGHFASGAKNKLSPIDKAIMGAFGKPIQIVATLFNTLFTDLGKTFNNTMTKATSDMTKSFESSLKKIRGLVKAIVRGMSKDFKNLLGSASLGGKGGEANVKGLFGGAKTKIAPASANVSAFAPAQTTQRSGLGRRIGLTTRPLPASMTPAPTPAAAQPVRAASPKPEMFKQLLGIAKDVWKTVDGAAGAFLGLGKKAETGATEARNRLSSVLKITKNVTLGVAGITLAATSLGLIGGPAILGVATSLGTMGLSAVKAASMFIYAKTTFAALFAAATTLGGKIAAIAGLSKGFKRIGEVVLRSTGAVKGLNMAMEAMVALGFNVGNVGKLFGVILTAADKVTTGIWRLGAGLLNLGVLGARGLGRIFTFFSTLGGVGKKTYSQLYESHGWFIGSVASSVKTVFSLSGALKNLLTHGSFRRIGNEAKVTSGVVSNLTGSIGRLGVSIAAALGIFGLVYKVVEFFKSGTKAASDLNETTSRSKVVFQGSFGTVETQTEQLQKSFGILKNSQLDIASGFGSMATGAGMSNEASAQLANQMTKMAADLSSSVNITFKDAGEKIRSALAGQSEPLRQFGVLMDEDMVKAKAMAMGIARSTTAISEQAKIQSRAALVMEGLAYALNDLARTGDQVANQFRKAGGGIAVFGEMIGEVLLPVINAAAVGFNELLADVLTWVSGNIGAIKSFVSNVVWGVRVAIAMIRNWPITLEIARLKTVEFAENVVRWFQILPANLKVIWDWLGRNWWNLLVDMVHGLKIVGTNLVTNAANLGEAIWDALHTGKWNMVWVPLTESFKATTEKLPELIKPELVDMSNEIKKNWAKITEGLKVPGAEGMAGVHGTPTIAIAKPEKEREYKLAGAVEIGSKEAFSSLSQNISNKNAESVGKRQLTVQQSMDKHLGNIAAGVKEKMPSPVTQAGGFMPRGAGAGMLGVGIGMGNWFGMGVGYRPKATIASGMEGRQAANRRGRLAEQKAHASAVRNQRKRHALPAVATPPAVATAKELVEAKELLLPPMPQIGEGQKLPEPKGLLQPMGIAALGAQSLETPKPIAAVPPKRQLVKPKEATFTPAIALPSTKPPSTQEFAEAHGMNKSWGTRLTDWTSSAFGAVQNQVQGFKARRAAEERSLQQVGALFGPEEQRYPERQRKAESALSKKNQTARDATEAKEGVTLLQKIEGHLQSMARNQPGGTQELVAAFDVK